MKPMEIITTIIHSCFGKMFGWLIKASPKKKVIKICLLGDPAVGKSSYHERLFRGDRDDYQFSDNYNSTKSHNLGILSGQYGKFEFEIHLFDTAGQEKYGKSRECYLSGSDAVIAMYSIADRSTAKHIADWVKMSKDLSERADQPKPLMVVCGNKIDEAKRLGPSACYLTRKTTLEGYYGGKEISFAAMSVKADKGLMTPLHQIIQKIYGFDDMSKLIIKPKIFMAE